MTKDRVRVQDIEAVQGGQVKFLPFEELGWVQLRCQGTRYWLTPLHKSSTIKERDDARVGEVSETPPVSL